MTALAHPGRFTLARHGVAIAVYVALVTVALAAVWYAAFDLIERRATVAATETMLAQLEGRAGQGSRAGGSDGVIAPPGSPVLEGRTVNVAGAALLQRVGGAVSKVGGSVLSSQIDLQRADAQSGWIGLVASCDINLDALQRLIYDLEAGMPFIFVDQLVVQGPTQGAEGNKIRLLIAVSAQWGGAK